MRIIVSGEAGNVGSRVVAEVLSRWKPQGGLIYGCILLLAVTTMSVHAEDRKVGVSPYFSFLRSGARNARTWMLSRWRWSAASCVWPLIWSAG